MLEADKALPERIAPPEKPKTVKNPFAWALYTASSGVWRQVCMEVAQ